jgi:hypothetical protein
MTGMTKTIPGPRLPARRPKRKITSLLYSGTIFTVDIINIKAMKITPSQLPALDNIPETSMVIPISPYQRK